MKILKFLKIFLLNIFFILIFALASELFCFLLEFKNCYNCDHQYRSFRDKIITAFWYARFYHRYSYPTVYDSILNYNFRPVSGKEFLDAKKIILLGCSFTYGDALNNDETFSKMLSSYTHSTVYNFGICGSGVNHAFFILQNDEILDKLLQKERNIDYVIYTYIEGHENRLYQVNGQYPYYKITKDNKFLYNDNKLRVYSCLYGKVEPYIDLYKYKFDKNYIFSLYLTEMFNTIKMKFKNAKFVLFLYDDMPDSILNNIDKDIIVIKRTDLTDIDIHRDEYISFDGYHPNKKVWEILVPKISNVLKLQEK
jgi:hypothetical protein